MFRFTRAHSSRLLAVIAAGAVIGTITTGLALASPAASGYQACANASRRLALENSSGHCPSHYKKVNVGARGPAGPSGVVSMTQYAPSGAAAVSGNWGFLGAPPQETFSNGHTAAMVTGTVDEASANGSGIFEFIGICYERVGGSTVTSVSYVEPEFTAAQDSYFAQTVSGAIGNLAAGKYYVGLCAADQSNVLNGLASVTITMAQTASGVSHDGVTVAPARHPGPQ